MNYSISTYNEIPGAMNSTSHVVSVVDGRASAGGGGMASEYVL